MPVEVRLDAYQEIIDGLLSTGDVGHFDDKGRLYIDGRDDEMIVSGGENVFPREVEELLVTHPAIADAAFKLRIFTFGDTSDNDASGDQT